MFTVSYEDNNKNNISGRNEVFIPFPSIISQGNSENDLNFQYFIDKNAENDKSIIEYFDNFRKINTTVDNINFKTNLKEEAPILYSFDDIKTKIFKNTLFENKFSSEISQKFIKDEQIEDQYLNKKWFRDYTYDDYINGFLDNEINQNCEQGNKKKSGRIPKIEGGGEHDRMTSDNIIKKIKGEIFKYSTKFLNNIINDKKTPKENNKIYKINYCFINKLNREIDLRYLNMHLKDLFSLLDVSPKYKNINPESNKIYIKKLLNGQTDETIKFVFNMTLRDWLDIFSFKKEIKDLLNEYNVKDNNNTICQKIKESLVTVDDLLNNIAKKEESKQYFSNFTFYLYNYELWFFTKKGRKSKINSNS